MNNRAERRRGARSSDRLINQVIRTRGDFCGICGRPFGDHDDTFYGGAFSSLRLRATAAGRRLDMVVAAGIYIAKVRP